MCWISLSARAHAFKENNFSLENLRAILWDANHEYKISYSIKLTVLPCFIFDLQMTRVFSCISAPPFAVPSLTELLLRLGTTSPSLTD